MKDRRAKIERKTKETEVKLNLNLDGSGKYRINTTIPFLDHMLSLFAKHGLFDLEVKAKGDTKIDYHHLVEDIGLCLGESVREAVGKKEGIRRFGAASVPMDDALVSVSLDLSGRPYLFSNLILKKRKIGDFDSELIMEFFKSFANSSLVNLHINQITGRNTHHIIEASFKAFGLALDEATRIEIRVKGVPSTKGRL